MDRASANLILKSMSNSDLSDLLAIEFEWGGRYPVNHGIDCLGLAIEVRRRLLPDSAPLPEFDEIYALYDRYSIPRDEIARQMQASDRAKLVELPSVGCLAMLDGANGIALGTFIGEDKVILFGTDERPIIVPDYLLQNLIGYYEVV